MTFGLKATLLFAPSFFFGTAAASLSFSDAPLSSGVPSRGVAAGAVDAPEAASSSSSSSPNDSFPFATFFFFFLAGRGVDALYFDS